MDDRSWMKKYDAGLETSSPAFQRVLPSKEADSISQLNAHEFKIIVHIQK